MTREKAIKIIKEFINGTCLHLVDQEALETLIPELKESEDERIRMALVEYFAPPVPFTEVRGIPVQKVRDWLEKQKDASKAIEAVERIDKYIDENLTNAHDMKDSNPDKKYYRGWDDALGEMARILQDVYSGEKQKESLRDFIDDFPYSDEQKEQKPIKWTDLTWKDIVELEGIINNVHYDFSAGIGQESFGKEVLERFRNKKDDAEVDACEQKPAECERQPEFKEVEYDFRGEKVKVMRPFFRDDKGREFSTTGQDTDLTWSVLREWCEIKGITPYDLYPRAEWSDEDKEKIVTISEIIEHCTTIPYSGGTLTLNKEYKKELLCFIRTLRPSWKPSGEQMEALKRASTNEYLSAKQFDILVSLYEQLKKL